jgi:hypothetical protein
MTFTLTTGLDARSAAFPSKLNYTHSFLNLVAAAPFASGHRSASENLH